MNEIERELRTAKRQLRDDTRAARKQRRVDSVAQARLLARQLEQDANRVEFLLTEHGRRS